MSNLIKDQKTRDEKLDKARDNKCEPVALKIIATIGSAKLDASVKDWEKIVKFYSPLGSQINQIMKDADLTISEVNYTWSVVQSIVDILKRMSSEAIQSSFEILQSRWLGVDNLNYLTLQKLDIMLQSK